MQDIIRKKLFDAKADEYNGAYNPSVENLILFKTASFFSLIESKKYITESINYGYIDKFLI